MASSSASGPDHAHLAVLGKPIAHSQSPAIHRAAYRALGLDWEYDAIELDAPELAAFLDARDPGWRGFSLTMPLKSQAVEHAMLLDPVAEISGVANTLLRVVGAGDRPQWAGFNTDVDGLARAVRGARLDASETVVLGAGATAISAVLAARSLGARRITVLARKPDAAEALAERFGGPSAAPARALPGAVSVQPDAVSCVITGAGSASQHAREASADATLCISTLPGSAGDVEIPAEVVRVPLFDVAYAPWPSALAQRWADAGSTAHSGASMLLHQALLQVRIFVNGDPSEPLENEDEVFAAMRRAGVEE